MDLGEIEEGIDEALRSASDTVEEMKTGAEYLPLYTAALREAKAAARGGDQAAAARAVCRARVAATAAGWRTDDEDGMLLALGGVAPAPLLLWQVLRKAREERGLSQREAARLTGVGQTVISRLESGRSAVREDMLAKIAAGYGVTIRELLLEGLSGPSAERQAVQAQAEQRRERWASMPRAVLEAKAYTADGLRELLADLDAKALGALVGVSRQAIEQRAKKLGV